MRPRVSGAADLSRLGTIDARQSPGRTSLVSDHTPPTSGTPEPARAPEPNPSPWAAPTAGASDPTYAPAVDDLTVSTADLSTMAYQPGAGGETLVEFGGGEPPARRPGRRRAIVLSAST